MASPGPSRKTESVHPVAEPTPFFRDTVFCVTRAPLTHRRLTAQPAVVVIRLALVVDPGVAGAGGPGRPARVQVFGVEVAMFALRTPTEVVFQSSSDLRSRFSLSHWDSMLLAACKEAGVATLYSEDLDSATDYDGLRVVNPFA